MGKGKESILSTGKALPMATTHHRASTAMATHPHASMVGHLLMSQAKPFEEVREGAVHCLVLDRNAPITQRKVD